MPRSVVVDASPLIFLSGAGLVDLLHRPDWDVIVPAAVRAEILRRGIDDVTVRALAAASWVRPSEPVAIPDAIRVRDLGPGESEVLALGLAHGDALLVIDDRAARLGAVELGVSFVGTLGLVLAAKSSGRIALARTVLENLRRRGMYLSDRVLDRALREVGE